MQVVLVILSLGLLALILYFAFSPKSSKLLRKTAFIALALIILSILVCGIFLIIGPGDADTDIPLPVFDEAEPESAASNVSGILVFLAVLLLILGIIILLAMRGDKGKKDDNSSKKNNDSTFPLNEPAGNRKNQEAEENLDEDSFDIELQ